jgi:hypothetical protein
MAAEARIPARLRATLLFGVPPSGGKDSRHTRREQKFHSACFRSFHRLKPGLRTALAADANFTFPTD